jgi:hypothetical protein
MLASIPTLRRIRAWQRLVKASISAAARQINEIIRDFNNYPV